SLAHQGFPLEISTLSTELADSPANQIEADAQNSRQFVTVSSNVVDLDFAFELAADLDLGNLPTAYMRRTGMVYHLLDDNHDLHLGQTVQEHTLTSLSLASGMLTSSTVTSGPSDDGINFLDIDYWEVGSPADGRGGSVEVEASAAGWIVGWIDFNQDADFMDAGEMIVNQAAGAGVNTINFSIPAGTSLDQTYYSRFRLFGSEPVMAPMSFAGGAVGGEVEDYSLDFTSLPVELLSFEAEQSEQGIELVWVTASEENTRAFEIERSIDGLVFSKIDEVAAAGSSQEIRPYRFDDNTTANLDFAKLFYRLKMVDLDGSFSYSEVESVTLSDKVDFSLMLAPSPPENYLKVEFTADPGQTAEIIVVNSLGQTMHEARILPEPGVNYWEHQVSSYLEGVYFIRLVSGQQKAVVKFIMQ
ncbi:MAG: T9SS type A sorting domain-containing protein, partial [Bacteroidota bacterium]